MNNVTLKEQPITSTWMQANWMKLDSAAPQLFVADYDGDGALLTVEKLQTATGTERSYNGVTSVSGETKKVFFVGKQHTETTV